MKSILALATLALIALAVEEKAREAAHDAHDAYGVAVGQAREATETVTRQVEQKPLIALLVAGGLGYIVSRIMPRGLLPSRG